ncbi:MAG: nitroreductase family protein [Planctomycetota bacterium]
MELSEAIRTRRSVKHFDPEHKISDEELRKLLSLTILSPTSFNMQNRHFVVVRDAEVKQRLFEAAWKQDQVRDASVVVLFTGDAAAQRNTDRYLRNAPPEVREMLEPMILGFYEGKSELIAAEACRSAGLAAMTMMLVAKDMGYDSCPMIGFDPARVAEILSLPENHPPLLMVVVGKAVKPARPRMGLLTLEEVVSLDRFGNHTMTGEVGE